jgi:predicted AlkP superfamily phosphohydrolase/phosphomutase
MNGSSYNKRAVRYFGTFLMILALLITAWPAGRSSAAPQSKPPYAAKQLFFVSDGMRPDWVEKWVQSGDLPNYAKVFNEGVVGENGMTPQFPPNTGAGWSSLTTGTWSGTHGTVNNTFHIDSNAIVTSTSAYNATLLQAET